MSQATHSRTLSRKPPDDVPLMIARFFAIPLWQRTAAGFVLGALHYLLKAYLPWI